MFRFRPEIRGYVKSLAELMEYANGQNHGRWAWGWTDHPKATPGVFGFAQRTIAEIVREECGQAVYDKFHTADCNFGGSGSWLWDIEECLEEIINPPVEESDE